MTILKEEGFINFKYFQTQYHFCFLKQYLFKLRFILCTEILQKKFFILFFANDHWLHFQNPQFLRHHNYLSIIHS